MSSFPSKNRRFAMALAGLVLIAALLNHSAFGATADFENLSLPAESFFQPVSDTTFESGGVSFNANVDNGWFYSNTTDTTTPGFTNLSSAITGAGVNGSATYGVAFDGSSFIPPFQLPRPRLEFGTLVTPQSVYITNTTFAYLAMRDGAPPFSAQFSLANQDFFKLDIVAYRDGAATGDRVTVTLANFISGYDPATDPEQRNLDPFDPNQLLLDEWRLVDLSVLGEVDALEFEMASSDVGFIGINTPAYFALDDLSYNTPGMQPVPVPVIGPLGLMLFSLSLLSIRRYFPFN